MELQKLNNSCIAMSTNEIAELTGKRHDHVIRDVEAMLNELEIGAPKFGATYQSAQGKELKCYLLPKDLTLTLVSGYNIKMRKAIIDRWMQLEDTQNRQPQTWQEKALFLAENLIEMNKVIESQKPAVEFVKALQAIEDSLKIGDFAKILFDKNSLVIGQNRLFQWLKDKKYLQQNRTPFQKYMDMGLFETVMGAVTNSTTGRIWTQTKVTGKGIVYLTQKILESGDFAPYNTKLISNK